jgi:hypothetical protein
MTLRELGQMPKLFHPICFSPENVKNHFEDLNDKLLTFINHPKPYQLWTRNQPQESTHSYENTHKYC